MFLLEFSYFWADIGLLWWLVNFVSYQYDLDALFTVFFDFLQPVVFYTLKGFPVMNVKYDDDSLCVFVICTGDCSETLLACSVPNL